jgi:hypothetical protein
MKNLMIIAALALVGSAAQAQQVIGQRQAYSAPQGLSVDGLRAACSNPNAIGNQIAPSSIRVSCQLARTVNRQVGETVVAMANTGSVVAGVGTDKGNTVQQQSQLGVASDQVSCPVMQQFRLTGNPEFSIDCATVAAIPSGATLTDLCSTLVAAQYGANSDAAYSNAPVPVGERVVFCAPQARGH